MSDVCVPVVGLEGLGVTRDLEEGFVMLVTLVFVVPCLSFLL